MTHHLFSNIKKIVYPTLLKIEV